MNSDLTAGLLTKRQGLLGHMRSVSSWSRRVTVEVSFRSIARSGNVWLPELPGLRFRLHKLQNAVDMDPDCSASAAVTTAHAVVR